MSVRIEPEKVSELMGRAWKLLEARPDLRPAVGPVLERLEERREDVATLGELVTLQALGYWAVVNPLADPPRLAGGYAAARAQLQGAGDRLQDDRDAELEALRRLRELALDVGRVALQAAVPLLMAAL